MGTMMSNLNNGWQVFIQNFPPKPTFSADQIPNLSGKVALVTGSFKHMILGGAPQETL